MIEAGSLDVAELVAWLESERAHHDLVHWVQSQSLAWPAAWNACPRGDWLLALANRAGARPSDMHRAALALATLVEDEVDHPDVDAALERLRSSFAGRQVSSELVSELEVAADGADDLVLASAYRVLSLVARAHDDPEAVTLLPSHLVELAMAGVGDCALMSVVAATQRTTAEIVRRELAVPHLQRKSESTSSRAPDETQ